MKDRTSGQLAEGRACSRRPVLSLTFPALAALVLFGLPGGATEISDDFGDGNDTEWIRYDPIGDVAGGAQGTWSFPNGGYRLQSVPSPNLALIGPSRVGSQRPEMTVADFQLSVDLVGWSDPLNQAMCLVARAQTPGAGTTKGYVFGYASGTNRYAQIIRVTNERTSNIPGSPQVPIVLDPNKDYRLEFRGRGDRLEGRIYALPNTTQPLVSLVAIDGTYLEGTAGVIVFSLNGRTAERVDATFDNYFAVDAMPAPLEHRDLGFGVIQLLWPGWAAGFKLESADALPATDWSPVDENLVSYFADQDRYIYQHDASIGQRFFRLRRP